ncbi:MAG: flagellar export chaperone FliS [Myxococcales bacterium]|nr:flagellar export chaperone FliS [Myxococcales bacterium]
MSFALSQYRSARVETASPIRLVVDLYRGALRHLAQARAYQDDGRPGDRGAALGKAHAIVSELQATLDHDRAPELSDELDRLYDFVLHRIGEANVQADVNLLVPAIEVLQTLESAWAEIATRSAP